MRLHFAEQHVQNVPETPGIFCLWDNQHLVYVGRTAPRSNLRAELHHALTMRALSPGGWTNAPAFRGATRAKRARNPGYFLPVGQPAPGLCRPYGAALEPARGAAPCAHHARTIPWRMDQCACISRSNTCKTCPKPRVFFACGTTSTWSMSAVRRRARTCARSCTM